MRFRALAVWGKQLLSSTITRAKVIREKRCMTRLSLTSYGNTIEVFFLRFLFYHLKILYPNNIRKNVNIQTKQDRVCYPGELSLRCASVKIEYNRKTLGVHYIYFSVFSGVFSSLLIGKYCSSQLVQTRFFHSPRIYKWQTLEF